MFKTATEVIVIGLGVGLLVTLFLYVWEVVLFKALKLSRVHIRVFNFYRNKKKFEEWKKIRSIGVSELPGKENVELIIPTAEDALIESLKAAEEKEKTKNLIGEEAVASEIKRSIEDGDSYASFYQRSDTTAWYWIRQNEHALRSKGYRLSYYMGKMPNVEVRWG